MNRPLASLHFSGSYPQEYVHFLLKPIAMRNTPLAEKEQLIQSGQAHYSQLLSYEAPPSPAYFASYQNALAANKTHLAVDICYLAQHIAQRRDRHITLVSLARAGTPIGILLKTTLEHHFQRQVSHYSVSIIRGKGMDDNALRWILNRHADDSLVFVDGWTGKGGIAEQLKASLEQFNRMHKRAIAPELYVLSDVSGTATVAAGNDDYLIPSCLLNATVSGLISRSVLDAAQLDADDFHGCYFYEEYRAIDVSVSFIADIVAQIDTLPAAKIRQHAPRPTNATRPDSQALLSALQTRYAIQQLSLIKPGIGEATRAFLRREAKMLLLKNMTHPSVQHLIYLAQNKGSVIQVVDDLPYLAVAIIKELA